MADEGFAFEVHGLFAVPYKEERGGRSIDESAGGAMFEASIAREFLGVRGCYVFGIRGSRGHIVPWHVGRTSKRTFESECFTSHKLVKYNQALMKAGRGTPVIFFVVHPRQRGKANAEAIDELETYLIQLAAAANPALLNRTKTEGRWWSVRGLDGQGRPTSASRTLARALEWS